MILSRILNYGQPSLKGTLRIPGDKSVSHRSIMFGAIAKGTTTVEGFLQSDDCLATIDCFSKLGVDISIEGENVKILSEVGIYPERSLAEVPSDMIMKYF